MIKRITLEKQNLMVRKKKQTKRRERERGGASFVCPSCMGGRTKVSRTSRLDGKVVRERYCMACGHKFRTSEHEYEE